MLKDELKERALDEGISIKMLEKEALQIYVLSELFSMPGSTEVTFQGGTCLRLIYNGVRYSEDLDFVTTAADEAIEKMIAGLKKGLVRLEPLLGGKFIVKEQKASTTFIRYRVHSEQENYHDSFFVSLEFARYPAYTVNVVPLRQQKELPGLPLTLVRAEKQEELLADKLCAVAGWPFCKGRDYFDLWLLKQQGIKLDADLLKRKLSDYAASPADLARGLKLASAENIKNEMERFLPIQYRRQLEADGYAVLLREAGALIEEGLGAL
ncbi:MAG: nucleotidyl transferase AbiEii/AbiGii toxin family protein [Candidatus Saganbacteria bacterium]|nr:nucleotidyl transferase AbiEii/AbiGii toxin family protein [Candidatus Saganbacteria bacterium]